MRQSELEQTLLVEAHREIARAAKYAVGKFGQKVPVEARDGFVTAADIEVLRKIDPLNFDHPLKVKWMAATAAKVSVLQYPPDAGITESDAEALESLNLSPAQVKVVERLIGEACQSAFFHFFCLMDSVADPVDSRQSFWRGARFVYPRKEGPMLHDEFTDAYHKLGKRVDT
jgi:hypothetical protein